MILSSRKEEWTKRQWPRGPVQGMEPHQIARLTSANENTEERRSNIVQEDEKRMAGGPHWHHRMGDDEK